MGSHGDGDAAGGGSDGLVELGGAAGIFLLFSLVSWLGKRRRKARVDQPMQKQLPWSRVWHVEVRNIRYTIQRNARPGDLRFMGKDITPADQIPHSDIDQRMLDTTRAAQGGPATFRLIVGRWGRRKEVRFETVAPTEELMATLSTMRVGG